MRIAVVASLVTPLVPAQAGGAQAFVADLARGLAARGHAVRLHCAAGSTVPGVELAPVEVHPSVEMALVRPGGRAADPVPALREGFERLFAEVRRSSPDVVSQHAFDAEALQLAEGLPVLHTLHLPPITPSVVAAAAGVQAPLATVSEAARRGWRAVGIEVRVLRNGVPDFTVATAPVEPLALIAGRISPEKGTAAAIRVATAAGLHPLVVGGIYDRPYFEREVRPLLGPDGAIEPLSRPRLWDLMARCAVTLMPVDWEEPFGLVAAESQLAGCPVAAYRRGGLPEVVVEGVGGYLVQPGDEAALAAAARSCLGLDRAAVRAGARGLGLEASLDAYQAALVEVAG